MLLWVLLLGTIAAMAKYTSLDVQGLANAMRTAKDHSRPFSLLSGAGCSISAEIPAALKMIEHINGHAHGEQVRAKLSCQTLIGQDYGAVMGSLSLNERKDILGPLLKNAKVNWGNIALATLMKAGYVGRVLTFNFDQVLARASGISGLYPAIYDFGVSPAETFDHIVVPAILHLHGQGDGLVMMNSTEETENHAVKLKPLFEDTFNKSSVLVLGYSGLADKVFPHIKAAFNNRHRHYWCEFEDGATPQHVHDLINKAPNTTHFLQRVDFDEFMIALAQELKCFPPKLFEETAQHVLDDISPIAEPPEQLYGAKYLLNNLRAKLRRWSKEETSVSSKLQTAMLKRDWNAAIGLEALVKTDAEKDLLAGAYMMQGNELSELGWLKKDEGLFEQSFTKYAAALKIKPDMHVTLFNWGLALSSLAQLKNDEGLFEQSFAKFAAALKIKPDMQETLSNWGSSLSCLAQLKKDEGLFEQSFAKFNTALKLKPDDHGAMNNLGNALLSFARLKNDEALFRESIVKFEDVFKLKPDLHEALYNWGTALSNLASLKNDEALFRESISKYEAALKLKPDYDKAMYNWGNALLHLFALNGDAKCLDQAEQIHLQEQAISKVASYNLACVYARQEKQAECEKQLLACKADGTLPTKKHLLKDDDFKIYREKSWFKALVAGKLFPTS